MSGNANDMQFVKPGNYGIVQHRYEGSGERMAPYKPRMIVKSGPNRIILETESGTTAVKYPDLVFAHPVLGLVWEAYYAIEHRWQDAAAIIRAAEKARDDACAAILKAYAI